MTTLSEKIKKELMLVADKKRAKNLAWFFKTGKGEYGEGDKFLGITLPEQREIVKKYFCDATLKDVERLFENPFHEMRVTGAAILVSKYKKADKIQKKEIYDFYLGHTRGINNWDLVDISCHKIVGDWLLDKSRAPLYRLARSKVLWERRISIISTFAFVDIGDLDDSYKLAEMLLGDEEDLMHKAVGWVLRECGKRDKSRLEKFIKKNGHRMPRTALRYAIEKFPENERKRILVETRS
jgi:3-methyladenine DNA glycosylase AlkD